MGASPTRTPRRKATSTSICSKTEIVTRNPRAGINSDLEMLGESSYFSIHKYLSIPGYLSYIYTTKWMLAFKCHLMRCHWDVPSFNTWTHGWFKNALGSPSGITFWIKPHVESRQWWFGPTSDLNQNTHLFRTFCENTLLSAHKHYCCFALSETFGQWPLALCKSSHASRMAQKTGFWRIDWLPWPWASTRIGSWSNDIQWSNLIWCHPFSSASQPCAWHQLPEHSIHSCTWKQGPWKHREFSDRHHKVALVWGSWNFLPNPRTTKCFMNEMQNVHK